MIPPKNRALRVLLGPQDISGYYQNLEVGLVEIGVNARLVTTHPHPFGYTQLKQNPLFARIASWAVMKHRNSGRLLRIIWALTYFFASLALVFWVIPRFDIFVFSWGTSFLPLNIDIPFLRLFKKEVISVMGHGSEARPPYMSTVPHNSYPATTSELKELKSNVRKVVTSVRRNEFFANKTIGMQMTAQFFSKEFIDFYRLGLPTPKSESNSRQAETAQDRNDEIVILHVPSNLAVKGTTHIRRVMKDITEQYPNVKYQELTGVGHQVILNAMSRADVVLDWLWSDIPMAVVGAEAASLKKPTIISSFGWEQWDAWEDKHGPEYIPPIIKATPESLFGVIVEIIENPSVIEKIGSQAKHFVESKWPPSQVARNYLRVFTNDIPPQWLLKPTQINYLWGAGVDKQNVIKMVKALLESKGKNNLCWEKGELLYKNALNEKALKS